MPPDQGTAAQFTATRWTVVYAAKAGDTHAGTALEQLCQKYYFPVYAFVRRQGVTAHDAQDLTQGFFADVLEREWLANVDSSKGKFRTFIIRCLKNFLSNEREKHTGPRRNPGQPLVYLDAEDAEDRYKLEPLDFTDPALEFERRWAMCLVERVLNKLKASRAAAGAGEQFDALHPFLIGENEYGDVAGVAARLGTSEQNVRTAASRLRAEFKTLLRQEIEEVVESEDQVEEEIQYLFQLFAS